MDPDFMGLYLEYLNIFCSTPPYISHHILIFLPYFGYTSKTRYVCREIF